MPGDFVATRIGRDFQRSHNRDRIGRRGRPYTSFFFACMRGNSSLLINGDDTNFLSTYFDPPDYIRQFVPTILSARGGDMSVYDTSGNPYFPALAGVIPAGRKIRFTWELAGVSCLYDPTRLYDYGPITGDDPDPGQDVYVITDPLSPFFGTTVTWWIDRGSVATLEIPNFLFAPTADAWTDFKPGVPIGAGELSSVGSYVDTWTSGERLILNRGEAYVRRPAFWRKRLVAVAQCQAATVFQAGRLVFQPLSTSRAKFESDPSDYYAAFGFGIEANVDQVNPTNPLTGFPMFDHRSAGLILVTGGFPGGPVAGNPAIDMPYSQIVWGSLIGADIVDSATPLSVDYTALA